MSELPSTPTPESIQKPELSLILGEKRDPHPLDSLIASDMADAAITEKIDELTSGTLTSEFFRSNTIASHRQEMLLQHLLVAFDAMIDIKPGQKLTAEQKAAGGEYIEIERLARQAQDFWDPSPSGLMSPEEFDEHRKALDLTRDGILEEFELSSGTNLMRATKALTASLGNNYREDGRKVHRLIATMLYFERVQSL